MKSKRIEALVASVPATIDAGQRARLDALATMSLRCEARRAEVWKRGEQALRDAAAEPDPAIDLTSQLVALEQAQPRIDGWLTSYVAELVDQRSTSFGEGPV